MGRDFGQPEEHIVMRYVRFKPSDGAKFRETFEKKHGPRGRDLIESLGQGSYNSKAAPAEKSNDPQNTEIPVSLDLKYIFLLEITVTQEHVIII